MKILIEFKKQLFKDFSKVAYTTGGIILLYGAGIVIEKSIHANASKDKNVCSINTIKEIYKTQGIKGFFKGSTFTISFKLLLEILKDLENKIVIDCSSNSNSSGNSNNDESILKKCTCNMFNKIINKFNNSGNNNNNNNNNLNNTNNNLNSPNKINTIIKTNNNLNLKFNFNFNLFKLNPFINIFNEILECPLNLIRDCLILSPKKFKFKKFFKSLKTFKTIKLFGYYICITLIRNNLDIIIDNLSSSIQEHSEKQQNSLFNYLRFIIFINNNLIIKSYLQSIILCPLDFIRIQYSVLIIDSIKSNSKIGANSNLQLLSPFSIIKKNGISKIYEALNISFINNILLNILIKYLYNFELIFTLITIAKKSTINK